jgi:hypothetical protein
MVEVMSAFTWLQWPVKIKGYKGASEDKLHITARFMGVEKINPEVITNLIRPLKLSYNFPAAKLRWCPDIWGKHFVLELKAFPNEMREVNEITSPLYPSQYAPWRPHITVDEEYWNAVCNLKIQAEDVLTVIPCLQLFIDGQAYYRWVAGDT